MSRWIQTSCPKCPSHDAFSYKEGDTFGYCFSCARSSLIDPNATITTVTENYSMHTLTEIKDYDTRGFKERGITKTVADHYGVKVSYGEDGTIYSHFYPYTKDGVVVAYKQRDLPKSFLTVGAFKDTQLFGQDVAQGGKRIVITEGELDCLAVAQAQYDKYQRFYPVVAMPSSTATNLILEQRDWLRTFDEVVLMLDMDEPGRKATEIVAKIIGYDKVRIAKLPAKDPCEVLIKDGGSATLMQCVFNAQSYSPAGVVRGQAIWDQFQLRKEAVSVPYPTCLSGLNDKLDGMRMGEIVLFTSGTGSGKSTVIKEIVLDVLERTQDMVGMVSLEESIGDTAEKFIRMSLKVNNSDPFVTEGEQYSAFEKVFGDERLVLLDHQGSVSNESLIDKIEYLALMGCKYIILDHLTIAISEGVGDKTGNEAADSFMSDLLKLVKKHNVWLGVISHLRKGKNDQTPFEQGKMPDIDSIKGSGAIKQISFDIVAFARNSVAEEAQERNTIKFRVLKARFTGNTGDCGSVLYDTKTGRLTAISMMDFE
jgi:twinkle protein